MPFPKKGRTFRSARSGSSVDTGPLGKQTVSPSEFRAGLKDPFSRHFDRRWRNEGMTGLRADQISRRKFKPGFDQAGSNEQITGVKKRGPTPTKARPKQKRKK